MSSPRFQPWHNATTRLAIAVAIVAAVGGTKALSASEGDEKKVAHAALPANSYRVDNIDLPDGIDSEVGALAFNEAGELVVVTRHSGILIGTPSADSARSAFQWRTFCDQILDNPVGVLAEPGGTMLIAQRHELTRLHDTNEDGLADYFEAVATTEAPITAGTQPDGDGNWLLALAIGKGRARWQGWTVKAGPDGMLTPLCSGFHQSGGIATDRDGNFFATDTAGDWNSEHALRAIEESLFHGDPAALLWDSEFTKEHADPLAWAKNNPKDLATKTNAPTLRIPAGDFCAAPGELVFHLGDEGSFGPFSSQCFMADSGATGGRLLRAMPELIEGKWQGSVTRFEVEGLSGANAHRLCFSPDGSQLFVGQRRVGNSADFPPKLQCITAVRGESSFAIRRISPLPSGLQLSFTDEVDRSLAIDPKTYSIERHPADDSESTTVTAERVIISPDGQAVTLFCSAETVAANSRYAIDLSKLKSSTGRKIASAEVHHTIHGPPADLTVTIPHPRPRPEGEEDQLQDAAINAGTAPTEEKPGPADEKEG